MGNTVKQTGKTLSPNVNKQDAKRLGIFFFYDKDGIVDRYVDCLLKGMQEVLEKLVVVVNGTLSPDGRDIFSKYASEILVRENEGLDVWAYKTALEFVGWENLESYDEVVLFNHTIMGPVYPFSEMFQQMAKDKQLDFWGATKHLKIPFDPFGCCKYGYVPEHIQSSFIVYRKRFIRSRELRYFWEKMPKIRDYNESIGYYESYFTKYFSDMGFRWGCYVDNSKEKDYTNYLLMVDPQKALEEYRCPFFKRRSFFQDADYCYTNTTGEAARELFVFLKEHTDYDTDLILENLIRSVNQYDLVRTLGAHYVLPGDKKLSAAEKKEKCAMMIHSYYEDQIERTVHYAGAMPENADIYVTTPHKHLIEKIEKAFSVLPNRVEVRLIENRGRDVSSLLVGCADVVDKYEYLCFYHDKKVNQVDPKSVGSSFCYLVSESTLHSRVYVENVLETFRENPRLGMLSPVPPCHGEYYLTLGQDWGPNYDNTVKLMEQLRLNVPISRKKPPVAPLGTVFWFRAEAMKKLFAKKWKYTDFPQEPNGIDGTFLHAVERIYPYVVQDAGYYPAYVMPDFIASIEINMMTHYLRSYNSVLMAGGIYGTQRMIRDQLMYRLGEFSNLPQVQTPAGGQPFGCREAFALAVNNRLPFLFRKTAQRFPKSVRTIGFKQAFALWRIRRICRRAGFSR